MRFDLRPPQRIHEAMVRRAFLAGLDRVPWRARTVRRDAPDRVELVIDRNTSEAASLSMPWPIPGHGYLALSTGTLTERDEPYSIPLELARGKIGQLRNQLGEWKTAGLDPPPKLPVTMAEATRLLGRAVSLGRGSEAAVAAAEQALQLAVEGSHMLSAAYAEQATAFRRTIASRLPTLLGAGVGWTVPTEPESEAFSAAFNAACVPVDWRTTETAEGRYDWDSIDRRIAWCRQRGLAVGVGPLVQFDSRSAPDWLYLCEGDADTVLDVASDFVRAAVARYAGKVDFWLVASRINTGELLGLSEADRLQLAATLLQTARSADRAGDVLLSIDQPWGEYLAHCDCELPPIHFADALLRADLGVTGLCMELNVGFSAGASSPRDPLDLGRMLDYWSGLGVPLFVSVSTPSQPETVAAAGRVAAAGTSPAAPPPDVWSPVSQQAWVLRNVPVMLARTSVRAVLWSPLRDGDPHLLPSAGLLDVAGQPKPALRSLAAFRKAHLR